MTPIVLIPGFCCTGDVYQHAVKTLWRYGSVTLANPITSDSIVEVAKDILDQAPPTFALGGFSMGGFIALELMRQAPERIERLCMISTMARPDSNEIRTRRQGEIDFAKAHSFPEVLDSYFPIEREGDQGRSAEMRAIHRSYAAEIGKETYICHFEMIRDRPDSRPLLPQMTLPVSVIVGDGDVVTPPETGQEMVDLFPNVQYNLIKDAGHFALLEHPEIVGEALSAWMEMA